MQLTKELLVIFGATGAVALAAVSLMAADLQSGLHSASVTVTADAVAIGGKMLYVSYVISNTGDYPITEVTIKSDRHADITLGGYSVSDGRCKSGGAGCLPIPPGATRSVELDPQNTYHAEPGETYTRVYA